MTPSRLKRFCRAAVRRLERHTGLLAHTLTGRAMLREGSELVLANELVDRAWKLSWKLPDEGGRPRKPKPPFTVREALSYLGALGDWAAEKASGAAGPDHTEWSRPNTISQWAKTFGISRNTMSRRLRDGKIRSKKLSDRLYQIAKPDLPSPMQRGHM